MSMYNLDLDGENSKVPSHPYPIVILPHDPLPMYLEKVHISPIMENILSERNLTIQEKDHPSSYDIE